MKAYWLHTLALSAVLSAPAAALAEAENYLIDTKGAHAAIQFRIQHLGFSWLVGRFDDFEGTFTYDAENPANSSVEVTIDTASVNSNHAERDKHLRDEDFLHVEKYPTARFVSTAYRPNGDGTGELTGDLTLHGVTRPVNIAVEEIGHGDDPWGGYRRGFAGNTKLKLADYGIDYDLGPASREVHLFLSVEGIRQ
jgi:polyisoprenoid-binding protein YceI